MSAALQANAERDLLPLLLGFLTRCGRLRTGILVAAEFPWNGRRVDLATLGASGVTNAYELKLRNVGRALEQAVYNTMSFDRSWVVLPRRPNKATLALALDHGVGIIALAGASAAVVQRAPSVAADPAIRSRLASKLTKLGEAYVR